MILLTVEEIFEIATKTYRIVYNNNNIIFNIQLAHKDLLLFFNDIANNKLTIKEIEHYYELKYKTNDFKLKFIELLLKENQLKEFNNKMKVILDE